VLEDCQELVGNLLHLHSFCLGQRWRRPHEEVEDRKVLFVEALGERAGLLVGQRLLEGQQLLEEGFGVHAAGVVVGDQLLEPFDEVDAHRVETDERGDLC
jgi:hypothetical protein